MMERPQTNKPSVINGRLPTRSETRPITGLERNDVNPCMPNSTPLSAKLSPMDNAYNGRNAIRVPFAIIFEASVTLAATMPRCLNTVRKPWRMFEKSALASSFT